MVSEKKSPLLGLEPGAIELIDPVPNHSANQAAVLQQIAADKVTETNTHFAFNSHT